jgi:citrate lyase subunit beta / citryl-CoA lyase
MGATLPLDAQEYQSTVWRLSGGTILEDRKPEASRNETPLRRSLLFVPANRPKFVGSAHERGADCIALDLEDSVPAAEKSVARNALREAVPSVSRAGADVFVRVNKAFEILIDDLDAAISTKPAGIIFPKVESADEVKVLDALVSEREIRNGLPRGSLEFEILIESPRGLEKISEIAAASTRQTMLSLGLEDLSKALEIDLTLPGCDLSWAHGSLILAARANGHTPMGLVGSLANISDLEAFARVAAASRQFGYVGAGCIHPNQVSILNREFSPSADELAKAKEVVEAFERAEREGKASVAVDGRMVDIPVVERARRKLSRASSQRSE